MKDNPLSLRVNGITLPNGEEVVNIQFDIDIALLIITEEDNVVALMRKLELHCEALESTITLPKSVMLSWNPNPPDRFSKFAFRWGGSDHIYHLQSNPI